MALLSLFIYSVIAQENDLKTKENVYLTGHINDSADGYYEITVYLHNAGADAFYFDNVDAEIGPERSDMGPSMDFEIARGNTTVQPGEVWKKTVTIENPAEAGITASCICVDFAQGDDVIIVATGSIPEMTPNMGVPKAMEYKLR